MSFLRALVIVYLIVAKMLDADLGAQLQALRCQPRHQRLIALAAYEPALESTWSAPSLRSICAQREAGCVNTSTISFYSGGIISPSVAGEQEQLLGVIEPRAIASAKAEH